MMWVLSPACATVCANSFCNCKVFSSSIQINIFTEEVIARLNITCKTIIFKDFVKNIFFNGIKIKTLEKGEKNSGQEWADTCCFQLFAHAMIFEFDCYIKKNNTITNYFVHMYMRITTFCKKNYHGSINFCCLNT